MMPRAAETTMPTINAAAAVAGTVIAGAPAAGVPSSMRPELRARAVKPMAISSSAAPSTQASRSLANERAIASSLANIANGGKPSRTIRPTANDTPISRDRRITPVISAMAVESCAACS
ncbi:Uncharacterised protein [Mycobacterium tuberculosis]|nr:Uncharacterised protein [Mycobacterium tuberculosis]